VQPAEGATLLSSKVDPYADVAADGVMYQEWEDINRKKILYLENDYTQGYDGVSRTSIGFHQIQAALGLRGDTQDIRFNTANGDGPINSTSTTKGSGLNLIVLDKNSTFVARGGFEPPWIWTGRTVVINPGLATEETFTITDVVSKTSIKLTGEKEWSSVDTPIIRKISSALKNPSMSDFGTTVYYDLDQRVLKTRIQNQIISPSNTDAPLWGTNFTGWHGTKATDSNGVVVIDLYMDHNVRQLLTHKPIVIATVDPTLLDGAENTGTVKAAYVVVQKYTNWNESPVLAQTGYADELSYGNVLVAQNGNNTVSKFASGLVTFLLPNPDIGDTVYRYQRSTKKFLGSGTVTSVGEIHEDTLVFEPTNTNPYAMTTDGITSWSTGDVYVVYAQIRKIFLKVYEPYVNIANSPGAIAVSSGIGVHYMVIPKANRIDNLPFTGSFGNDVVGLGPDTLSP